ncbi:MAG: hypothetical protein IKN96_05055 [Oscillibacter sp.]|nr:hypothetical protein [Oscillibacter sp.]
MNEVQAVINNISFPKTLEEVFFFETVHGCFNVEDILFDAEDGIDTTWTMPKWCKIGDIVFFYHAKTANVTISRLKGALRRSKDEYNSDDYAILSSALERALELYQQYGGKIFAVGKVCDNPYYQRDDDSDVDSDDDSDVELHWKSKIYARIDGLYCLKEPIDLSEFKAFIALSTGGAITPVFGKEFDMLKALIMSKNAVPRYLEESVAMPIPLAKITGDNWIQVASQYRRSFFLEKQFRAYYVDYLLESLGDRKGFFVECPCIKRGRKESFADNVIILDGKYLPVEVKLNIHAEKDLVGQLRKYCALDALKLDKNGRFAPPDKLFNQGVLTIDTDAVYWYSDANQSVRQICALDSISAKQDILALQEQVILLMRETESGSMSAE